MSFVWSPVKKFRTWRLLWIALATAEKELGERRAGGFAARMVGVHLFLARGASLTAEVLHITSFDILRAQTVLSPVKVHCDGKK